MRQIVGVLRESRKVLMVENHILYFDVTQI
jgi:hypothetical protein